MIIWQQLTILGHSVNIHITQLLFLFCSALLFRWFFFSVHFCCVFIIPFFSFVLVATVFFPVITIRHATKFKRTCKTLFLHGVLCLCSYACVPPAIKVTASKRSGTELQVQSTCMMLSVHGHVTKHSANGYAPQ